MQNHNHAEPEQPAAKLDELAYHSGAVILALGTAGGQAAVAPLRGALRAYVDGLGPRPQFFAVESDVAALRQAYHTLHQSRLADHSLLFLGDLIRFHREIPITPSMVAVHGGRTYAAAWSDLNVLRTFLAAGTPVLVQTEGDRTEVERAIVEWTDAGFYEALGRFGDAVLLRTSRRCTGRVQGLEPEPFTRLQSILLSRHLAAKSEATPPMATGTLTRPVRTTWRTAALSRGCSGHGPWPFARPAAAPLPPTLPNGHPWPRISIITASFNQGKYIQETLLSVANQGYPNVEHIVMDGGSTDETLAILQRHRHHLAHMVSERDRGQSHAINKGFALATGEIVTWLNSDDMLAPGALAAVALAFHTSGADMVAGICQLHNGGPILDQHLTSCGNGPLPLDDLLDLDRCWSTGQFFYQPEVMFTRALWQKAGGRVNEALYFSMDYELWLRFAEQGARLKVIGRPVAMYRQHPDQKTYVAERFQAELRGARDAFLERTGRPPWPGRPAVPRKSRVRMVFCNDIGGQFGAGTAHARLAQAAADAGQDVEFIGITPVTSIYTTPLATNEAILGRLERARPDVVVLGNVHGASLHPSTLGLIAQRWPTLFVLHDIWALTGRCAYTGGCEKYLTGCDHACPTPTEYPRLEPHRIHDAWLAKRRVLTGSRPPVLLTDSEWVLRFAQQALRGETFGTAPPMAAIRYGFPLDIFYPREQRLCRELFDLPQDRFIILASGTTVSDPRKGIKHLAAALHRLQLPDVLVVAIGHLQKDQPPPIPGLRTLGYIDDPRRLAMLYSAVDLFVGPSLEEAFGQVFIEAAACGTPSVGYPVGGVPEAVVDGLTGRVAAAVHPDALAEAIEELYRHPDWRRQLGGWARLYVENEYSLAAAYHRLFTELTRLGVRDQLGLAPKIALLPEPPVVGPAKFVDANVPCWRPVEGFGPWEEPRPHSRQPRLCRALGPVSRFHLQAERAGRHCLLIRCRNSQAGQRVRLMHQGRIVAENDVPVTSVDGEHVLHFELDLDVGLNNLELHHWKWDQAVADLPVALVILGIECARLDGAAVRSVRGTQKMSPPRKVA